MYKTVKTVAAHSLIYGLGDLLTKVVGFLLIPFYTNYLDVRSYGVLELLDLTSYVIALFLAMGLSQAMMKFYFDFERQEDRDAVLGTSLFLSWGTGAIALIFLFSLSPAISNLVLQSPAYSPLFNMMFFSTVLTVCAEVPLTWLRIREQSALFTAVSFVRTIASVLLNIVFIACYGMGVMGVLLASAITGVFMGSYVLIYMLRRIRLSFSWPICKRILAFGFWLIGSWFAGFILNFADRFLLQRLGSLTEVGIYALSYKFGFLLNVLLLAPFQRSWVPKQFEIAGEPEAKKIFSLVFTYYCALQFLLTLGISVTIQDVLELISAPEYQEAYRYVPVILLAYNFYGAYSFLHFNLLYTRRTKLLALVSLLGAALNVAANLKLIPLYGALGAAWATLISFAFLFFLLFAISQRVYYIPFDVTRLFKLLAAAGLLYFGCMSINVHTPIYSLLLKGGLACLYPFLLYFARFYSDDELQKMKELLNFFHSFRV